jgi:cytochrome b6-f complex iron-sulfur subunit
MFDRRSFLGYFSIGWLTACFPVVLAACTPSKTDTATTEDKTQIASTNTATAENKETTKPTIQPAADGFMVVGSVTDLGKAGYLQTKEVAVTRDPADATKLLAVNPKCTHNGCAVKWMASEKKYECPCHDAYFAPDGKVLKGPAKTNLATYPVKIVGTQVLVKV